MLPGSFPGGCAQRRTLGVHTVACAAGRSDAVNDAQSIERRGFRKWYERELVQSHVHLVLLLLCAIGLLASTELFGAHQSLDQRLIALLCGSASALIGVWALRRYLYFLSHAEYVAGQAACSACEAYARWEVMHEDDARQQLHVRCRRCGNEWHITL
jgi:hypothetical protein